MSEIIAQPSMANTATGAASVKSASSNPYIENIKNLWDSSQRNLVLSAVLAAIVAAIIVVALWSSSQNYRPLYGQQERFDSGEIMSFKNNLK